MARFEVSSIVQLSHAIGRAAPLDTIELNPAAFGDWTLALCESGWMLTNGEDVVPFASAGGARVRIKRGRFATLLVGDNGHPCIQAAIDAARGGETILIAPGTYREGRVFAADELLQPGMAAAAYGLVVNKSVTLQGVADDGTPITDRDKVSATAVALFHSAHSGSFAIAAAGVTIRGLGFVPASRCCDDEVVRGITRVFEVHGERFNLLASVVERGPTARALSAVHFSGRGGCAPVRNAVISGNLLCGSISLEGATPGECGRVVIRDNDIVGDLLPPVWISCDASVLASPQAEAAMPVVDDNTLRTRDGARFSMVVQCDDAAAPAALAHHGLDGYLSRVLDANGEIGAVLLDASGSSRMAAMADPTGVRKAAYGVGIYASTQAAMGAARAGDTLSTSSGIRRGFSTPSPVPAALAPARDLSETGVLRVLHGDDGVVRPVRLFDGTGRPRGAYPNIQAAIDLARDGDRISVPAGPYPGDLYIGRPITLTGANAGKAGSVDGRGVEAAIVGCVVIGSQATHVVIDGFAIIGSVTTELAAEANQHLALRNCVIDGRDMSSAIAVLSGSGTSLANNVILGGVDEAIYVPYGFEDLAITGNRIRAASGGVAIALNGGAGADSVRIFGNTILGGDYGVLIEVDSGLEQAGDFITIAGNQFGELLEGAPSGAPVVACVHADAPVPATLERSLGASLELNTYNVPLTTMRADVRFESRKPRLHEARR
ncbi:MAG: right-handed parallel beta-helix repeat-containing protein [Gammaproteobacteria bacterium]